MRADEMIAATDAERAAKHQTPRSARGAPLCTRRPAQHAAHPLASSVSPFSDWQPALAFRSESIVAPMPGGGSEGSNELLQSSPRQR